MPELKEVLESVEKETKALGDNVKGLKESTERSLKEVRDIAERAGKDANGATQIANDIKSIAEGVAAKHQALEDLCKKLEEKSSALGRIDELERKLNRLKLAGGSTDSLEGKAMQSMLMFHKTKLAAMGQLKVETDISEEAVPVEEIKAYSAEMHKYIRRDIGAQGAEQKTMSVGSDPDGGYFVTPQMSPRILSIVYESSPLRALAAIENVSTDAMEFPVDTGEMSSGWVGEQETRSATNTPQVGVQRIPVHEMYAFPKATQKLLEDASVDVEGWIGTKIGEKFGRVEATAFVTGDGIKKPRGFTTYANGTSWGQIEQVVSGHATSLTFDGLINLTVALKEPYVPGAVFLMRRATVGVVMLMKDGDGQYIWRTDNQAGKPSVLLGHPVYQAADMAATGASALAVAFGNFKQGYTIVDRLGISILRDALTAKPFVGFYARKRVGGDVTNFEAIKLQVCST